MNPNKALWEQGDLMDAGNRRAKKEGLENCRFAEGDASDFPELKDHTFDLVVSIFGAMFAPQPFDVAKEMVRLTRPGGRIVARFLQWQSHPRFISSNLLLSKQDWEVGIRFGICCGVRR